MGWRIDYFFIDRAHAAKKPFFVWFNSSRMHANTHLRKEFDGKTVAIEAKVRKACEKKGCWMELKDEASGDGLGLA